MSPRLSRSPIHRGRSPTDPSRKEKNYPCVLHGSPPRKMIPRRPFYIISFAIMLLTKAAVVVYMLSTGDLEFLIWKNAQEYIQTQRTRILKQLMLAIITFRVGRHMLKRSVVMFLIFTIVVIKLLSIQVKLVKLFRSLRSFNGPVRLTACIMLSGGFFYLKLVVEISWAIYYLVMLCRNPCTDRDGKDISRLLSKLDELI